MFCVDPGCPCHVIILSSILLIMKTRLATVADAPLITSHRRRMFVDAGRRDDQVLQLMAQAHEPWVAQAISDGRYLGWLTEDDGKVIAGAGLLVLDWPPHPLDPRSTARGYLLNVYVEPEYRRRRLASNLIELALAEARRRGIRVVALHSTEEGRRLYEAAGFRSTNEMFFVEPVEP
jgi:ribosomal protein S18 acetylase RimI-like enzyme